MTTIPIDPAAPAAAVHTKAHATSAEGLVSYVWGAARLMLGWIFLWPFLDKAFGLNHETASAKAWIHGGSPTTGSSRVRSDRSPASTTACPARSSPIGAS